MSNRDTSHEESSQLQSGLADGGELDVLEAMFLEAEPQPDPAFTIAVVKRVETGNDNWRLWSVLGASVLSLLLIASQFSVLSDFVSTSAQPVLTSSPFSSAEAATGGMIALLILGVLTVLRQTQQQ